MSGSTEVLFMCLEMRSPTNVHTAEIADISGILKVKSTSTAVLSLVVSLDTQNMEYGNGNAKAFHSPQELNCLNV